MGTRRVFLRAVSAGVLAAVAGCLGEVDSVGSETGATENRSGRETEGDEEGQGENGDEEEDHPLAGDPFIAVVDGDERREAVTYDQVASIGEPTYTTRQGHTVPVQLTAAGTESYTDALEEAGALESPREAEIVVYDGEGVHDTYSLAPDLATEIEDGEYDGRFVVLFETESEATAFADSFADGE